MLTFVELNNLGQIRFDWTALKSFGAVETGYGCEAYGAGGYNVDCVASDNPNPDPDPTPTDPTPVDPDPADPTTPADPTPNDNTDSTPGDDQSDTQTTAETNSNTGNPIQDILASTGYGIIIPIALSLAVIGAGTILLVKRLRRRK